MRVLLFAITLFLTVMYLLLITVQEPLDPEEQQGVLLNFKEKLNEMDIPRTSVLIDQYQNRSDKQQERITRLQTIHAMIQSK